MRVKEGIREKKLSCDVDVIKGEGTSKGRRQRKEGRKEGLFSRRNICGHMPKRERERERESFDKFIAAKSRQTDIRTKKQ